MSVLPKAIIPYFRRGLCLEPYGVKSCSGIMSHQLRRCRSGASRKKQAPRSDPGRGAWEMVVTRANLWGYGWVMWLSLKAVSFYASKHLFLKCNVGDSTAFGKLDQDGVITGFWLIIFSLQTRRLTLSFLPASSSRSFCFTVPTTQIGESGSILESRSNDI